MESSDDSHLAVVFAEEPVSVGPLSEVALHSEAAEEVLEQPVVQGDLAVVVAVASVGPSSAVNASTLVPSFG